MVVSLHKIIGLLLLKWKANPLTDVLVCCAHFRETKSNVPLSAYFFRWEQNRPKEFCLFIDCVLSILDYLHIKDFSLDLRLGYFPSHDRLILIYHYVTSVTSEIDAQLLLRTIHTCIQASEFVRSYLL